MSSDGLCLVTLAVGIRGHSAQVSPRGLRAMLDQPHQTWERRLAVSLDHSAPEVTEAVHNRAPLAAGKSSGIDIADPARGGGWRRGEGGG